MGTLDTGVKTKTYSILASDLVFDGTGINNTSDLYVTVAANTAYRLEAFFDCTGSADSVGIKFEMGSTPVTSALYKDLAGTISTCTLNSNTTIGTGTARIFGVFISPVSGMIRVKYGELFSVGGSSTILAGAYVLVEPI